MKNIQNLTIDINKKPFQTITANKGEVGSRFIKINIVDNSTPVDLTGVTISLYAKKPDGKKVFNSVTIEDKTNGVVLAELTSQILSVVGIVRLTLLLVKDGSKLASKQFLVNVDESIVDDEAIESTNEFTALVDALGRVNNIDSRFEEVDSQLEHIENDLLNSFDIIPDRLRDSDSETDADLLQKSINLALNNVLETKTIKLNRKYIIDEQIYLNKSASHSNNSIHINIEGGQLELGYDGFMFDGIKNSGGITFTNTLFLHGAFTHTLFNCRNLIQLDFNHCQFKDTYTICEAEYVNEDNKTDYIQSIHFNMCNFKGMRDYQIKCMRMYDFSLTQSYVEWGRGGFCKTYQKTNNNYSALNVIIRDNVIEGISEQIPLDFAHTMALNIEGNYFEGNSMIDIRVDSSVLANKGFKINGNFFGDYNTNEKECNVYIGLCQNNIMFDLKNNRGTKAIFYIKSGAKQYGKFDITGSSSVNVDSVKNYSEINSKIINISNIYAHKNLTIEGAKISIPFSNETFGSLLEKKYIIDLSFNHTVSGLYRKRLVGNLYFVSGYDTSLSSVVLKAIIKPDINITNNLFADSTSLSDYTISFASTGKDSIPITGIDYSVKDVLEITHKTASTCYKATIIDINKIMAYN